MSDLDLIKPSGGGDGVVQDMKLSLPRKLIMMVESVTPGCGGGGGGGVRREEKVVHDS